MPDEHPFNIKWKNEKIEFITVPQIKLLEPDGSKGIITYLVTKCYYPENLREYKSDIIKLVIDGLETYGYNYGRTEGTEVIVKILPTLGNLQLEPLVKLPADNSPIKN